MSRILKLFGVRRSIRTQQAAAAALRQGSSQLECNPLSLSVEREDIE